jgi:preprotein translocase subunit SecE
VAERKRRADDDTVDAVDAVDEDLDEATADAPADEKPARKSRPKADVKKADVKKKADASDTDDKDSKDAKDAKKKAPKGKSTGKGEKERRPEGRRGPISRIGRFIREVVAELRKVIWPSRKDLVTYAAVVLVFVAVMLTIVGFLDFGFAKATLAVFGSGSSK